MRKVLQSCAICDFITCLYAKNEIFAYNNNISKIISKRIRSGLALWSTISKELSFLAIINFSDSPLKEDFYNLKFVLEDNNLRYSINCYRAVI